jgi:hypothetical protein
VHGQRDASTLALRDQSLKRNTCVCVCVDAQAGRRSGHESCTTFPVVTLALLPWLGVQYAGSGSGKKRGHTLRCRNPSDSPSAPAWCGTELILTSLEPCTPDAWRFRGIKDMQGKQTAAMAHAAVLSTSSRHSQVPAPRRTKGKMRRMHLHSETGRRGSC